jgi:hypothetical protein
VSCALGLQGGLAEARVGWAARLSQVGQPGRERRDGPFPFSHIFFIFPFFILSATPNRIPY